MTDLHNTFVALLRDATVTLALYQSHLFHDSVPALALSSAVLAMSVDAADFELLRRLSIVHANVYAHWLWKALRVGHVIKWTSQVLLNPD